MQLKTIAKIYTDFPEKFGLPRQSGIAPSLRGTIIFEEEYRNADSLRGIDGYSHIWIIWGFSEGFASATEKNAKWYPTVRPPRLGGNKRMGVFATRSPNRPNPIALSSVKLENIEKTEEYGTVIHVSGIDMMNGTPIYDIKPYLPHIDSIPEAVGGFATDVNGEKLSVDFPKEFYDKLSKDLVEPLTEILREDPRPSYQNDENRVYTFGFGGYQISFRVTGDILTIVDIADE